MNRKILMMIMLLSSSLTSYESLATPTENIYQHDNGKDEFSLLFADLDAHEPPPLPPQAESWWITKRMRHIGITLLVWTELGKDRLMVFLATCRKIIGT
jgi:hypothetical protein